MSTKEEISESSHGSLHSGGSTDFESGMRALQYAEEEEYRKAPERWDIMVSSLLYPHS